MGRPKVRTLVVVLTLALLSGCGSSDDVTSEVGNSPESTTTILPEGNGEEVIQDLTESEFDEGEVDDPLPSATEPSEDDGNDSSPTVTPTTVPDIDDPSSEDLQETGIRGGGIKSFIAGVMNGLDRGVVRRFPRHGVEHREWALGGFVPAPCRIMGEGQKPVSEL